MMLRVFLCLLGMSFGVAVTGCESDSAAKGFCMGADGTHQDCKICCDVDKADECCQKAKKLAPASSAAE